MINERTIGSFIPVILTCIQLWFSKKLKMSNSWPENHHLFPENRRFFEGFEIRATDSCLILIFFFFFKQLELAIL